jgi:hypothetical protein
MNPTWLNSPLNTDSPSSGDDEIIATRTEFYDRLVKEHVMGGTTLADGWHREGSAKAYYTATAPTTRADGSTALDSDDAGRIWIESDTGQFYYHNGTAWYDLIANTANTATGVDDQGGGDDLLCKIIEIGDWNMDTTESIEVAHGLTYGNIRSVQVVIRRDTNLDTRPLDYRGYFGDNPGGAWYWNATIIKLGRYLGGNFDNADYNSTSYNRGWITIWYVAS